MIKEEKNKGRGGKPGVARRISALVALPLLLLGKTLLLMARVPLALLSTVLLFPLVLLVGLCESRGGIAGWILGRVPGDDVWCSLVATLLCCLDPLGGWADIWERIMDIEWWYMIRGMALVVLGKAERADNNQ